MRCVAGLSCFGLGIALFVVAKLGLAPWDVFHQGVSELTGLPMGTVIILTGLALLAAWIPLRQRVGIGTILNAVVIGVVVDLVLHVLPSTDLLAVRVAYLVAALAVVGIGSGLYIGAGLGNGPRDGIMVGLAERGISVRLARTAVEVAVLAAGLALGGTVGVGTVAFMLGIGPIVHVAIPRLTMRPADHTLVSGRDFRRIPAEIPPRS